MFILLLRLGSKVSLNDYTATKQLTKPIKVSPWTGTVMAVKVKCDTEGHKPIIAHIACISSVGEDAS